MNLFLPRRIDRKGATITNFLLIIGLIFVSVAALGVLRRLALSQASHVETDYTVSMAEQVKAAIEKASSYPSNAEYSLKFNDPVLYQANISENRITFRFTKKNITTTLYFFSAKSYIIPSSFENSGIINIYKKNDYIYVTDRLVCNTSDEICDAGCIALGVCDPACKSPNERSICNPYCLDTNRNGKIDAADSDNMCIPACYTNFNKGIYDIDCVDYEKDEICDPATNNIRDGICDPDCLGTNGVCDPDCPQYDADCPSKGNGICEPNRGESCLDYPAFSDCNCSAGQICKADCPALSSSLDYKGCVDTTLISQKGQQCTQNCQCNETAGLICDTKFGTMRCCPPDNYFDGSKCISYKSDNKCQTEAPYSENCANSPHDCACVECCLNCNNLLENGCCPTGTAKCERPNGAECITPGGKSEGQKCDCNPECNSGVCSPKKDDPSNKACCPQGKEWDGIECEETAKLKILLVPVDWEGGLSTFPSAASNQYNNIINNIPLKSCPDKAKMVLVNSNCEFPFSCDFNNGGDSYDITQIKNCALASGESYDYIIGLTNQDFCGGVAGFSNMAGTVFVETFFPYVAVHELGHEWGLNDEYLDACRCGHYGLVDPNSNCLEAALGGNDPIYGGNPEYCAGGSLCGEYTIHCLGNHYLTGRSIMSYANAPNPRGFDQPSWNWFKTIPILNC